MLEKVPIGDVKPILDGDESFTIIFDEAWGTDDFIENTGFRNQRKLAKPKVMGPGTWERVMHDIPAMKVHPEGLKHVKQCLCHGGFQCSNPDCSLKVLGGFEYFDWLTQKEGEEDKRADDKKEGAVHVKKNCAHCNK